MADGDKYHQWEIEGYVINTHILPGIHFKPLGNPFAVHINDAVTSLLSRSNPVVSSIHGGVTADLVNDGVNGYVIDPNDTEDTANTIIAVLNQPPIQKQQLTERVREKVERHSFVAEAEAMVNFSRNLRSE